MARETIESPLGDLRAASTASGGTPLTATLTTIGLPLNAKWLTLIPRNFAGAAVLRFALNPWLVVLRTQDSLVSFTDFSDNAQDNDTGTSVTWSEQSTVANGDAFYVGSHIPFRGVAIDVDGTNGSGSATLTVNYWNNTAWADITNSDGTRSSAAFDQDGNETWTVPGAWVADNLNDIEVRTGFTTTRHPEEVFQTALYWTRWELDAAITDTSVTLDSMRSLNRSTAYAETPPNFAITEKIARGIGGISCVEALVNAGAGNLIVDVAALGGEF